MNYGDLTPEILLSLYRESCNYGPLSDDSDKISALLKEMTETVSWEEHWQLMLNCVERAFKNGNEDLASHILVTWIIPQGGAQSALEACTSAAFFNFVYARCSGHVTDSDVLTCLENNIDEGEDWGLTDHLMGVCQSMYFAHDDQERFNRIIRKGIESALVPGSMGKIASVLLRKGVYNMSTHVS